MTPENVKELETLIDALHYGSIEERSDAAREIGLIKFAPLDANAKLAVSALIEALSDQEADVRVDVAQALMCLGATAFPAIPALIQVLTDDKDPDVREFAVHGLNGIAREIGLGPYTAQVLPLLTKALYDDSFGMRGAAAGTLGNLVLSDQSKISEVISALEMVAYNENEDKGVRAVAIDAIGKLQTNLAGMKRELFSAQEWQVLQFAVFDVFMMVSQIEGATGMDEAEKNAFMDLQENPTLTENLILRELLASIAPTWKQVLTAYQSQYQLSGSYFEQAFSRVKTLIDTKLSKGEAQAFKVALALQFGGIIANASGTETGELGRVSNSELKAMTAIAKWLGTDMTR